MTMKYRSYLTFNRIVNHFELSHIVYIKPGQANKTFFPNERKQSISENSFCVDTIEIKTMIEEICT